MIEIRCDVCGRVVRSTKLVVSKTTPFVLGNGTLVNPENHVCLVCIALRLQAVAGRESEDMGKSEFTHAVLQGMADQFVLDDVMYRPDVEPPLEPALGTEYGSLNIKSRRVEKGNRARSKFVEFEGARDVRTLVMDALAVRSETKEVAIDLHDHDGTFIGSYVVNQDINMEGNHRLMASNTALFPKYSRSMRIDHLHHHNWFNAVWEQYVSDRSVYLRVYYKDVASIYVFFGSTKKQVKHLMDELKARVDRQNQSTAKSRIKE